MRLIMGGNATAEFGSVRLSAQEYNDVTSELEKIFSNMNFDDDSFGFIKSYKSKESFGDVDCLITMDNSKFNNLLSESKNIKVVAKKGLSYAMQVLLPNGEYSKTFQFDYIKSSKESFNFAFKYAFSAVCGILFILDVYAKPNLFSYITLIPIPRFTSSFAKFKLLFSASNCKSCEFSANIS